MPTMQVSSYMQFDTMLMQLDWSYATLRRNSRSELTGHGTRYTHTHTHTHMNIHINLSPWTLRSQLVLLMQRTRCSLFCVRRSGIQGAHVTIFMLQVYTNCAVLMCDLSSLWSTQCGDVTVAFINGRHKICTA